MAHRKPLGTTCRITFADRDVDWTDDPPRIDDFLVSEAGTAYRIVGEEEGRTRTAYVCERVADTAGEGGRRVFVFYWMIRERLRA